MGYRRSVQDEELWNACKQYGHVVDAFIPDRRSKIEKRFGFVRFIKVFDAERLHANIARFQRPTGQNSSRNFGHNGEKQKDDKGNNGNFNSVAHVLKGVSHSNGDTTNTPSLVTRDECVNQEDYSFCLNGKVKEFGSLSNLKVVLGNEGFNEIEIRYLGGLWVMLVFRSVCGKEKFKGKTFWVRAKEVPGWSLEFEEQLDEDSEPEDDIFGGVDKPNTDKARKSLKMKMWFQIRCLMMEVLNLLLLRILVVIKAGLEEIPLGGCSFTWCHKSRSKMSKLDQFLASESLLSVCPTLSSITLDRFLLDHWPILLRESTYDYGPSQFRFFKYWAEVDGFEKLIVETWSDTAAYKGNASEEVIYKRLEIVNSINELEKQQAMETAQKAKIKWAIEGDENSKYYHGILNKKGTI
nr:RNA-directed DNA polymerase, eukaryota, reverse transcriptase zinc-binding domain protein [Tanacetum cinerariifolium]